MERMREFLKKHSYLVVWVCALVIIGAIAELIIRLNGIVTPLQNPGNQAVSGTNLSPSTASAPFVPPVPHVTIALQKLKTGNLLWILWENLPDGTVTLRILRGRTGTDPQTWQVWKTISLSPGDLSGGNSEIDVGPDTENGYSFQVEATGRGGTPENGSANGTSTPEIPILWLSSSTVPAITTSTPIGAPEGPSSGNGGQNGENPPNGSPAPSSSPTSSPINSGAPSSSSTSSPANQPPATPPSPSSSETGGQPPAGNPPPSGTPYYTPQIQIETYGTTPTGTFLAENQNQGILLSWQNLSAQTTEITVSRSESEDGPWTTVLVQQNPGTSGSYMLQLIDSTVGIPYYYQMSASQGGDVNLTYGPVYVPAP